VVNTLEGEKPGGDRNVWRQAISGTVLIGFGLAILMISWNYSAGSLTQMGPGFMPRVIAVALVAMGLGILVSDLRGTAQSYDEPIHWRALIFVSAAVLIFVTLVEPAGLVPAMFCAVAASKLANSRAGLLSIVIYSAAVTLAGYFLFIVALGLPLTVFGR
tara:strand:+ start:905 stop:1384 length:480 start_codon:yes stop_codon:yes gene_type:complete